MSAATNRPTSVFISYSRVDSAAIDHLQAELISYGFATWVDRQHLEGGDVWAAGIERAIQGCDVVVVGLSPDAVASPWVTNELFYAHNLKKQIIPVVIRPVESIPLLLSAMQFIDMQADESQGLQQLRLRLLRLDEQTNVADFDLTAPVSHHLPPNPEEETSDPMAELVELPEPTPAIDSNELFIQGISALAHKNLDQAEALLLQVVDQDKNFGNGIAARKLGELQRQLLPHQLERLHFQAHQAELQGAWDEAVGAWSAYVERAPDDTEAQAALTRNQQNRDAAWLYVNAHILAQQQDWPAFCEMWELLREQAPGYGDPGSIYHPSVEPGTLLGACCDGANYVWSVAWSPDGRRLATASDESAAKVWDAASGRLLFACKSHECDVHGVAWSPDGQRLATASEDKTAKVWSASNGAFLAICQGHTANIHSISWSPDGQRLATSSEDETARVWDANTGELLCTCSGYSGAIRDAVWSPNGQYIATAGMDGAVRIWDADNGTLLVTYRDHTGAVYCVEWSPDGSCLASGGLDQIVRVWDATTGSLHVRFLDHIGTVYGLAWSPDGQRIATVSDDKTARIWDARTGTPLITLEGHAFFVWSVAWSPDGLRLATGSGDGSARVWRV